MNVGLRAYSNHYASSSCARSVSAISWSMSAASSTWYRTSPSGDRVTVANSTAQQRCCKPKGNNASGWARGV